jgi:predicted enzyme related to lactoylglutathione lyase
MGTLQGSWIWYELMTPDPAGSKAFYDAVVRWSMTPGGPDTDGYGFITAADGAMIGGVLALTKDMTGHGARPCWLGYVGVDNVDASVGAIESAGGKCLMPARDVPMAGRIAMVADPGGAPFYIMAPTPPPGGGESTAFQPEINCGHCGWNELLAGDAPREVAFYTGQFGWSLPEPMDMGPMGKYQFVAHDGVTVGAIMPVMPQTPAPFWNHYFWVPSIAAAKTAIEVNRGQVINGPMQVPGGGWIVQGIDPQGAMFSLVGGE